MDNFKRLKQDFSLPQFHLFDQIQSVVREVVPELYGVGQVPVTISTFTNERKLYLSPGVNMRTEHPESLRNPVQPDNEKTKLKILRGNKLSLTSYIFQAVVILFQTISLDCG